MQDMLRSMFESKGIKVPEQDYDYLVTSWKALSLLKGSVEQAALDDSNIVLLHIPNGGYAHE
jgi:uncharacterized protein (DUF488 family)